MWYYSISLLKGMPYVKIKATIMCNCITEKDIEELNASSSECLYSLTNRKGFALPPEVVMIVIELLQNIGYNAAYDLIKTSILMALSKISVKPQKKTRVIVINDGKKSEIQLPFEVTEEQKDKLVDAAIEKWRT